MSSRTVNVIRALYGREVVVKKPKRPVRASRTEAIYREFNRHRLIIGLAVATLLLYMFMAIFYYNQLMMSLQDVQMDQAKVESVLQRRYNLMVSLARTVRDYAIHEQRIFRHVSDRRLALREPSVEQGGEKPAEKPGPLDQVTSLLEKIGVDPRLAERQLTQLMAIAEQYPDLKLSENFRRFMDAVIEVEKDVGDLRQRLAEKVNDYTTKRQTFPGNVFAKIYSFEDYPYYQPTPAALAQLPVEQAVTDEPVEANSRLSVTGVPGGEKGS